MLRLARECASASRLPRLSRVGSGAAAVRAASPRGRSRSRRHRPLPHRIASRRPTGPGPLGTPVPRREGLPGGECGPRPPGSLRWRGASLRWAPRSARLTVGCQGQSLSHDPAIFREKGVIPAGEECWDLCGLLWGGGTAYPCYSGREVVRKCFCLHVFSFSCSNTP